MSHLFGELFSNNGIKSHFLSNYLDITYVLSVCSPLFLVAQCHPCLFLSFYWMLLHNYIFPRGNSCDILFKSPQIDKHMYFLLTMELYVIWIRNSSFEVPFLHNFGASADENGQQEWTFIPFLSNLFFFNSGIFKVFLILAVINFTRMYGYM